MKSVTPKMYLSLCFALCGLTSVRALATPAVSRFDPLRGPKASFVIITGTNLTGATEVTINGVSAPFTVQSATRITFRVPSGADSGLIEVTTPNGSTTSSASFTVTSAAPVVAWGAGTTNTGADYNHGQSIVPVGLGNAKAIAAGNLHSLALKTDGTVVGWGYDFYGQTVPAGLSNVVAIAAEWDHSLALKSDGTVFAWGAGGNNVPAGLSNVVAITVGSYHSLALKGDGTVVPWGISNVYGQLNLPAGLSNVVGLAAGYNHSLALKSDGTVVGWGDNTYGQSTAPAGLSNVVAVAAGVYHSLAIKSDGTVVAWGNNDYGAATAPAGLSNVVALAAGLYNSLALKSNGSAVGWGTGKTNTGMPYEYGQTSVPAEMIGIVAIACGDVHTLRIGGSIPAPVVQFSAAAYTKTENGSNDTNNGSAVITVTRTGATGAISVDYATSDGSAKAGEDYTTTTGTLNWVAGNTTPKTFIVPLLNDTTDEFNQTVRLTLSTPTGGAVLGTPAVAYLTITDNDPPPLVYISDATGMEGDSGTAKAKFIVQLSAVSERKVIVKYRTRNLTATSPEDYVAIPAVSTDPLPKLIFAPGEVSKTIIVLVKGDTIDEGRRERFDVILSDPFNATLKTYDGTLNDRYGIGTITDDDPFSTSGSTASD